MDAGGGAAGRASGRAANATPGDPRTRRSPDSLYALPRRDHERASGTQRRPGAVPKPRRGSVLDDGCIAKAPGGGKVTGRSRVGRGTRGFQRSGLTEVAGLPRPARRARAPRRHRPQGRPGPGPGRRPPGRRAHRDPCRDRRHPGQPPAQGHVQRERRLRLARHTAVANRGGGAGRLAAKLDAPRRLGMEPALSALPAKRWYRVGALRARAPIGGSSSSDVVGAARDEHAKDCPALRRMQFGLPPWCWEFGGRDEH